MSQTCSNLTGMRGSKKSTIQRGCLNAYKLQITAAHRAPAAVLPAHNCRLQPSRSVVVQQAMFMTWSYVALPKSTMIAVTFKVWTAKLCPKTPALNLATLPLHAGIHSHKQHTNAHCKLMTQATMSSLTPSHPDCSQPLDRVLERNVNRLGLRHNRHSQHQQL